jgi:hypothetical protein
MLNAIHSVKESTCGYLNCNTNWILRFGEYFNVEEFLYTWDFIAWVNTILKPFWYDKSFI